VQAAADTPAVAVAVGSGAAVAAPLAAHRAAEASGVILHCGSVRECTPLLSSARLCPVLSAKEAQRSDVQQEKQAQSKAQQRWTDREDACGGGLFDALRRLAVLPL